MGIYFLGIIKNSNNFLYMIDSIVGCLDVNDSDAVILAAPYEESSSYRKGASNGPREIKACLDKNLEFFDRFTLSEPAYDFKISYVDLGERDIENLAPEMAIQLVSQEHHSHLLADRFVLLLGGEHTVAIGAFDSVAKRYDAKKITIVQIDAHLDMREDDSDYNDNIPSKFAHSCVMRRAHNLGFQTVHVGIRTYGKDEYTFAKEQNLPVFEWGRGDTPSIKEIMTAIKTEDVYLTVDIDGLDPSCAPATGTPVPGGLSWDYFMEFTQVLFQEKNVIGSDIVEVAPREGDVLTQYTAAQMCYTIIGYALTKKRDGSLKFL